VRLVAVLSDVGRADALGGVEVRLAARRGRAAVLVEGGAAEHAVRGRGVGGEGPRLRGPVGALEL